MRYSDMITPAPQLQHGDIVWDLEAQTYLIACNSNNRNLSRFVFTWKNKSEGTRNDRTAQKAILSDQVWGL